MGRFPRTVKYGLWNRNTFAYLVRVEASLVTKEGMEIGWFSGAGSSGGPSARFSADSDDKPMNVALQKAIQEFCRMLRERVLDRESPLMQYVSRRPGG
jgi:hypothetical protein